MGKRGSREVWQGNADSAAGHPEREEGIVLYRFHGGHIQHHGLLEGRTARAAGVAIVILRNSEGTEEEHKKDVAQLAVL